MPAAEICGADAADELSRQRTPPRRASPNSRKRERLTQTPLIRAAAFRCVEADPDQMAEQRPRDAVSPGLSSYGTSTSRRNKAMSDSVQAARCRSKPRASRSILAWTRRRTSSTSIGSGTCWWRFATSAKGTATVGYNVRSPSTPSTI